MLTAADVGLSSSDWTPQNVSDPSEIEMTPCAALSPEVASTVVSFAEAGSVGAGEIGQQLAVFDSDESAQDAYAEVVSGMTSCTEDPYSPAGPADVSEGEAAAFVSTDDEGITHIVGTTASVVYNVGFYGAYTIDGIAPRAAERAAG